MLTELKKNICLKFSSCTQSSLKKEFSYYIQNKNLNFVSIRKLNQLLTKIPVLSFNQKYFICRRKYLNKFSIMMYSQIQAFEHFREYDSTEMKYFFTLKCEKNII